MDSNSGVTSAKDPHETTLLLPGKHPRTRGLDWAESSFLRWFHVVFWSWLNPILNVGSKRQLNEDDLFDLSQKDECSKMLQMLEEAWEKRPNAPERISIWRIVIKTFWKEWLLVGLILFPYTAARLAQPLFMKQVILHIGDPNSASHFGYLFAIGLGLSAFFQTVLHQQFFFRAVRVGYHVRIALSSFIYKKLLSLPTRAVLSTTTGQMINLISNDAGKFEELGSYIHHIWEAPLEGLIAVALIWYEIGIPAFFGFGVLLLLIPLQMFCSKKFVKYRKNTINWADRRVKVVNEILTGCQIVKMYRWEEALEGVVYGARKNEVKSIRKASRIRALNMSTFFSSLSLISLATFGGSWLMGDTLTPTSIFTALALFSIIRIPLTNYLPYGIEKLSETLIAAKRINQFLSLCETVHEDPRQNHFTTDRAGRPGSVLMEGASFAWDATQAIELTDIHLNINSGSLVGIVGSIGSCKSSLLAAILGEMSLVQGTSKVTGKVAYVSQTAWIFTGTIRENILFYKPYDRVKYEGVLKACQLVADLRLLTVGDSTIVGEKGVNLSGGQKARVSLARAIYADADIYLFDDPLAAVDLSVARKIFRQCISNEGILYDKTRVLVTHQVQFLPRCEHCIFLNQGKIEKQGLFDELLVIDEVRRAFENHEQRTSESTETYERQRSSFLDDSTEEEAVVDVAGIVKEETAIGGRVSLRVWLKLFTSGYGWLGLVILIVLMVLGEGAYDANNKWLSFLSAKSETEQRKEQDIYVYLGLVIATWIIGLIRSNYFFHLILRGTSALHNAMFKGVLYSSLRFYESNPVGRILNRFSKDQQIIDELLPITFFDTAQILIMVVGSMVIIGMANPFVLIALVPIVPMFLWLRRFYLKTSRNLKRLEGITRSPIYALFSSSLSGLMTIRAFKMEKEFVALFIAKVDANTRALTISISSARWFGLRLDLMTCCLTFVTALLSVTVRQNMDTSSVALALSYCINLTALFQWGIRQSTETENYMTSAERIDEYSHLSPEVDFFQAGAKPPANWPTEGKVEFENFKLRYRPELEPVLKGLNLQIVPRNKIGIIGRTGAGKSSIFQALFRLTDKSTTEGQIFIDGVDISTISLRDLRTVLNIIPQSPVLFSNTLRYNLDPFEEHTDEQLWDALEAVQLKTKIDRLKERLNTQIAEYGSNFSVGECQLICVARAILKQSKILLIDEATAHVDTKTDELIQQILRERFTQQTIITIAHRLNTIMDSNQIVVMNAGIVADYGTPMELLNKRNELLTNMSKDKEQ